MSKIHQAIRDQVEILIRTNLTPIPSQAPAIKAHDLYQIFYSQFTPEGIKLIGNRANGLIHQYNKKLTWGSNHNADVSKLLRKLKLKNTEEFARAAYTREIAKVEYFGFTCTKDKVAAAALTMVGIVNHLAANNYAVATLEPLIMVPLADGRFCVMSYIAIDQQHQSLVESTCRNFMFQEGGIPMEFI